MNNVVVSLFPGIGLLDLAFEELGYCILRGPDVLWGGDIRKFHLQPGVCSGVIGGPPCQPFSQLVHMVRANGYEPKHGNLIPEFERVVSEGDPDWFLMEEVHGAPLPKIDGYIVHSQMLNNRSVGGTQNRSRRISFGTRNGAPLHIDVTALEPAEWDYAVCGDSRVRPVAMLAGMRPKGTETGGRSSALNRGAGRVALKDMCRLQGLPEDFLAESPLTDSGKRLVIGNGVPLFMGRAIARAVRRAMEGAK